MEDKRKLQDRDNLRKEAEDHVGQGEISDVREMSEANVRALLHELQVHQVELEMQNEELQQAKAEAEDALNKYSDLYDFAPVGYLTLNENGKILESNLAAATMLDVPRSELMDVLFRFFVAPENRSDFDGFCRSISDSGGRGSREITLLRGRKDPFYALVETATAESSACPTQCRITITNITRRKEAEDALQKSYSELEKKVDERTRELALARSEAERRAAEMESFVASLADGVVLFDADANITFINDVGMDILRVPGGESFEEWLQRYHFYDLEGIPIPVKETAVCRALYGETVSDMRGLLITPWGGDITLSMSATPVLNGEGEIIGATMVFRDQSARISLEKERQTLLEREQHITEILEQTVIPHDIQQIPGCRFAVIYEPALSEAGVGGDFYDIFELEDGKVGVLIGDVTGKGLAAAVGITAVRHSIRSYAYLGHRPSSVLTLANAALCKSGVSEEEFGMLTVFFAVIDTRFGGISYASGGHEPAVLKTANGSIERLEAYGPLLGVIGDIKYTDRNRKLLPGDKVVMVTDGITEARPNPRALFDIEGVERYLSSSSEEDLEAIAEGILQTAKNHAGGHFTDDAAIVVVSLENGNSSNK